MRAASVVPSFNGIKACSMTRTALGKVVTITGTLPLATIAEPLGGQPVRPVRPNFFNPRGSCDSLENSHALFVNQAQDQGIKAVGSRAGRDDRDQHEGIE